MSGPVIAFTGHRFYESQEPPGLRSALAALLQDLSPRGCITGMAIGFDMLAAEVCIDLGIPFMAAIPFIGQESKWPAHVQRRYQVILSQARDARIISDGPYASWKMQVRNEWMIDRGNPIVAYFTGTPGGTKNAVDYAKNTGKEVINLA